MAEVVTPQPRDYPQLFTAMNVVLRLLWDGGEKEDALRRSVEAAAAGFGAEKALLLFVERPQPLVLRRIYSRGLTDEQVTACERGESVKGVSSSLIRSVLASRKARVVENPYLGKDADETPALVGQNFSVLCAPVLDAFHDSVLAVMYFQNGGPDRERAYTQDDLGWLEGYASAVGRVFGFYFRERFRERERAALLQGDPPENAPELIGDSAHTQALRRTLHEAYIPAAGAPEPDPLLILGEKGTGKDLVVRYLHAYSTRRDRPLVIVNCGELTDDLTAARFFGHKKGAFTGALSDEAGLFRAADRGVLFLDEIAELSLRGQATLLRVLENHTVVPVGDTREIHVDVQVVLATNRDLQQAIADGSLKGDFFDRFRTQVIHLQPLRERPWDIPALVQHFLAYHERRTRKKTLGLALDAHRAMASYAWPGNVREVARVCSLLVTHAKPGQRLDRDFLAVCYPDIVRGAPNPKAGSQIWEDLPIREAVQAFRREFILCRLERHNWDLRAVREGLRLPKTTLRRYMRELGVQPPPNALLEDDAES
jgi:two-component system nitrogen regulation response regulator NtrX